MYIYLNNQGHPLKTHLYSFSANLHPVFNLFPPYCMKFNISFTFMLNNDSYMIARIMMDNKSTNCRCHDRQQMLDSEKLKMKTAPNNLSRWYRLILNIRPKLQENILKTLSDQLTDLLRRENGQNRI